MVSKNIACLSVFPELCLMSVEMLTSLSSAAPIEWYKNSLISSSSIIHGIFATRQEGACGWSIFYEYPRTNNFVNLRVSHLPPLCSNPFQLAKWDLSCVVSRGKGLTNPGPGQQQHRLNFKKL